MCEQRSLGVRTSWLPGISCELSSVLFLAKALGKASIGPYTRAQSGWNRPTGWDLDYHYERLLLCTSPRCRREHPPRREGDAVQKVKYDWAELDALAVRRCLLFHAALLGWVSCCEAMERVQRAEPDCQVPPEHVARCFIGSDSGAWTDWITGVGFSSIGARYVSVP